MLERSPPSHRSIRRQDERDLASHDVITRAELMAFARRHLAVVAACILLGMVAAGLYGASSEPTFTARTQILIDPKTPPLLSTQGEEIETSLDTAEVESQMTVLRSVLIATMVIDELDLTRDPEFQGESPPRLEMLIGTGADFVRKLGLIDPTWIEKWRETLLHLAAATEPAGGEAEEIDATRLAIAIFQGKLAISRVSVSYVIEIAFSSRDAEKAAEIANATAEAYLREQLLSKVAAMQQGNEWLEQRLDELRRKLNAATQATQAFRARHDYSIPDPMTSAASSSGEKDAVDTPTLEELEATADTYRKLYEGVLAAFTSSMQHQSYPYSLVRVITPAVPPFHKSHPRMKMTLAFGGLAGLLLGIGLALARQSLDNTVRSGRQVRTDLGTDLLAEVPRLGRSASGRQGLIEVARRPTSGFADAIGRLKMVVRSHADPDGGVAIGITSALPGEGRSTLASNLGLVCAGAGYRTLVIDADPLQATLSKVFPLPAVPADTMRPGKPQLDIGEIATFELLPQRAEAGRAAISWKDFRQPYEVVIVDLPPIEEAIDVLPKLAELDGIVMVAEWGATPLGTVADAIRIANALSTPLLGVVLTKVPRWESTKRRRPNEARCHRP